MSNRTTTTHSLAALPPDGVDLRAELNALRAARVRQALEQSSGDLSQAARLLRMSRLDLMRLEALDGAEPAPPPRGRRRQAAAPSPLGVASVGRIAAGVELISAAAIRRLAADGLDARKIAARVGCNHYLVERVLRRHTESEMRRLDGEGLSLRAIAIKLGLPLARVRRFLAAEDLAGAKS